MTANICVPFNKTLYFDETNGLFNQTITFFPLLTMPYVVYNTAKDDFNIEVYQICGPLILLLKTFAKKHNYRLRLMQPISDGFEMINALTEDPPHFILAAIPSSSWDSFHKNLKTFGIDLIHTSVIGLQELGSIAYKKYPGDQQIFKYFYRIELYLCLVILTCLFLISGALTIFQTTSITFFEYVFSLSTSIFSSNKPKLLKTKMTYSMVLVGPWLFSTMIIGILFRNYILEDMVKVIPNKVIDSWDDLYNRPDIEIRATTTGFISKYTQESNDEMAINFNKRLNPYAPNAYYNSSFLDNLIIDLSSGRSALSLSRLTLIYTLIYMHKTSNVGDKNFLNNLHVSKYGGQHVPYFTLMLESPGAYLMPAFNKIINEIKESGLYEQWVTTTLRSDGFMGQFDDTIRVDLFKFEDLIVEQIADAFYLLLLGYFISTFSYFCELFIIDFKIV